MVRRSIVMLIAAALCLGFNARAAAQTAAGISPDFTSGVIDDAPVHTASAAVGFSFSTAAARKNSKRGGQPLNAPIVIQGPLPLTKIKAAPGWQCTVDDVLQLDFRIEPAKGRSVNGVFNGLSVKGKGTSKKFSVKAKYAVDGGTSQHVVKGKFSGAKLIVTHINTLAAGSRKVCVFMRKAVFEKRS